MAESTAPSVPPALARLADLILWVVDPHDVEGGDDA